MARLGEGTRERPWTSHLDTGVGRDLQYRTTRGEDSIANLDMLDQIRSE